MSSHFCFREAQTPRELETLLRLRYQVYRTSRLSSLCPETPFEIDVDAYDSRALHFGLFHCEDDRQRAVGYMRIIQDSETPAAVWVRRIARQNSVRLLKKACAIPENPFPVMNYFPGAQELVGDLYADIKRKGERMCEGSRLVILPEFASARLGLSLIESAISISLFCSGFQNAVVSCCASHGLVYKNLCFEEIAHCGVNGLYEYALQQESLLHLLSRPGFQENAHSSPRRRVAAMTAAYLAHRCICFHVDRPGDYAPPAKTNVSIRKKVDQNAQATIGIMVSAA